MEQPLLDRRAMPEKQQGRSRQNPRKASNISHGALDLEILQNLRKEPIRHWKLIRIRLSSLSRLHRPEEKATLWMHKLCVTKLKPRVPNLLIYLLWKKRRVNLRPRRNQRAKVKGKIKRMWPAMKLKSYVRRQSQHRKRRSLTNVNGKV